MQGSASIWWISPLSGLECTHPFQNPKINPEIVPKVDHPTSGGKDTTKTHNPKATYASGACSHFSATGPSQTNNCPVKAMNARPRMMTTTKTTTVRTRCQRAIFDHLFNNWRLAASACWMALSRQGAASRTEIGRELRCPPDDWLHGGRIPANTDDGGSSGDSGSDSARAVDW